MQQKVLFEHKISYIGSIKISKGETNLALKDISHLLKPIKNNLNTNANEQIFKLNDKYKYYFNTYQTKNDSIKDNNITTLDSKSKDLTNFEKINFVKNESKEIEPRDSKVVKKKLTDNINFTENLLKNFNSSLSIDKLVNKNINLNNTYSLNSIDTEKFETPNLKENKINNIEISNNGYSFNSIDADKSETLNLNDNQINNIEISNSNKSLKNNIHKSCSKVIYCKNKNLINEENIFSNYIKSNKRNCHKLLKLLLNHSNNILCNGKKSNDSLKNNIINSNEIVASKDSISQILNHKSNVDQDVTFLGAQNFDSSKKLPSKLHDKNFNENLKLIKRSTNLSLNITNKIPCLPNRRFNSLAFQTVSGSQFKTVKCKLKSKLLENNTYIKDKDLGTCARVLSYEGRFKYSKPSNWQQKNSSPALKPSPRQGFLNKYPRIEYKRMKAMKKFYIQIRPSSIHGMGLFAKQDFINGDIIIEYTGEIIRWTVANKREIQYEALKKGCYMFQLNDDWIIDATHFGGVARYINHSCKPNCISRVLNIDGESKIVIMACVKISKGEELTYNYKFNEEDVKIVCRCRTSKCRGYLN